MPKTIDEHPKVTDTILFSLTTMDGDTVADPYKIEKVVIYFLARDFISGNLNQYDRTIGNQTYETYFAKADTIKVFGNSDLIIYCKIECF